MTKQIFYVPKSSEKIKMRLISPPGGPFLKHTSHMHIRITYSKTKPTFLPWPFCTLYNNKTYVPGACPLCDMDLFELWKKEMKEAELNV